MPAPLMVLLQMKRDHGSNGHPPALLVFKMKGGILGLMPIRPVGFTSNEGGIPDLMAIPHCWFYLKWREWRGDPGCHAHPPRWSHSRWRGDPGSNGHSPLLVLFEMKGNPGSNAPPVGSTSNEEESWIHCPPFRLNLILNEMEFWIQCPPPVGLILNEGGLPYQTEIWR